MDSETQSIVEKAREGDREAFGSLVRRYARLVNAAVYSMSQDRDEAEDIVQECFVKAWRSIGTLKEPGTFASWLVRIARNLALDRVRKRGMVMHEGEWEENAPDSRPGPEAEVASGETASKVREAVARLPEKHRAAVVMRFMEDMSHDEIEEAMGISDGMLRGLLARALAGLRKSLMHLAAAGEGRNQ